MKAKQGSTITDSLLTPQPYSTKEEKELTEEEFRSQFYKQRSMLLFICPFLLTALTFNGNALLGAASKDMTKYFNKGKLNASVQLSLSFSGLLAQIINSAFFLKVRHSTKMTLVAVVWTVAYIVYYFAFQIPNKDIGYWMAIGSNSVIGAFAAIGCNTVFGFLKAFPPGVINGASSGIGFAGLSGSLSYIFMNSVLGMEMYWIALSLIPTFIAYVAIFFFLVSLKANIETKIHEAEAARGIHLDEDEASEDEAEYQKTIELSKEIHFEDVADIEAKINNNLDIASVMNVVTSVGWMIFNISAVYFLKYFCNHGVADRGTNSTVEEQDKTFIEKNAYALIHTAYHVGSFVGKTALTVVKPKYFEFTTLFIFALTAFYSPAAYFQIVSTELQMVIMLAVGIGSGVNYCSCMYWLMASKSLKKENKEVAITVSSFSNETAISSAMILAIGISYLLQ